MAMRDLDIKDLSKTWQTWVGAFGHLRHLTLEPTDHGWWLDVGRRQQSARYFLAEPDLQVFERLARDGVEPATHFEMPLPGEQLEAILPAGWSMAATEFLMTATLLPPPMVVHDDIQLLLDRDQAEIHASCVDKEGRALSRGVCAVFGTDAIFDQIVTERSSRRQGLASAVMTVLTMEAISRGGERGVLLATPEGRPFYEALGWSILTEVSKAVSPVETRAARHLRIVTRS